MTVPSFAFFQGSIVPYSQARVGVLNHTLNYGTGAFGGIRAYYDEDRDQLFVFRPHDHFQRFLESARLLHMQFDFTPEELTQVTLELLRAEEYRTDCYIRPLAYNADEIIGVRLHDLHPQVAMVAVPFGRYLANEEGVEATFSSWRRIDDNAIPARGKITGGYVSSALVKTDAQHAGFDEALVLNQDGHVAEGSAENFFILRHGALVTPPVTENILEGITRRTVMELANEELGIRTEERPIDRTEVYLAEEAFFCGTGVQIAAIVRVDHRPIGEGKMGPFVSRLRDLYFRVVRGRVPKYAHWNTPVYLQEKEISRA
ncbi:MAG: branched-chain amino acid transaminase [Anaerolineales bacterium]